MDDKYIEKIENADEQYRCRLCDINMSGGYAVEEHVKGRKHGNKQRFRRPSPQRQLQQQHRRLPPTSLHRSIVYSDAATRQTSRLPTTGPARWGPDAAMEGVATRPLERPPLPTTGRTRLGPVMARGDPDVEWCDPEPLEKPSLPTTGLGRLGSATSGDVAVEEIDTRPVEKMSQPEGPFHSFGPTVNGDDSVQWVNRPLSPTSSMVSSLTSSSSMPMPPTEKPSVTPVSRTSCTLNHDRPIVQETIHPTERKREALVNEPEEIVEFQPAAPIVAQPLPQPHPPSPPSPPLTVDRYIYLHQGYRTICCVLCNMQLPIAPDDWTSMAHHCRSHRDLLPPSSRRSL